MSTTGRPNDIARETLRQLALRRIAPTPDNYRRLYTEISGKTEADPSEALGKTLTQLAAELPRTTPQLVRASHEFSRAVSARQWNEACLALADVMSTLVAGTNIRAHAQAALEACTADASAELRELLAQTLEMGVHAHVIDAPELADHALGLARQLRDVRPPPAATLRLQLKSLWMGLESRGAQRDRLQAGLLDLLRLLVENIGELVADDQWLRGQIGIVRQVIDGDPSLDVICEAKRNLKDVIFKQTLLKQSLVEAKSAIKQMAASFIQQIGAIAEATGQYHDKIEVLSREISQTEDVAGLTRLLDDVMCESRRIQSSTLRSRDEVMQARQKVDAAESKIRTLESELENVSEKAREDHLTGMMNRRGMNEAFERELAVSEREARPLSVALLDIDNFKMLNDTFGHQAGDDALVHLSQVIKDTVRPSDIVARYGGEEFLILLPDSHADEAINVVSRLQRELTRRFFLHDNRKLLITFSAGVAQRAPGEKQSSIVGRARRCTKRNTRAKIAWSQHPQLTPSPKVPSPVAVIDSDGGSRLQARKP